MRKCLKSMAVVAAMALGFGSERSAQAVPSVDVVTSDQTNPNFGTYPFGFNQTVNNWVDAGSGNLKFSTDNGIVTGTLSLWNAANTTQDTTYTLDIDFLPSSVPVGGTFRFHFDTPVTSFGIQLDTETFTGYTVVLNETGALQQFDTENTTPTLQPPIARRFSILE